MGVKIIPRGRLAVTLSGVTSFYLTHRWGISGVVTGYRHGPSAGTTTLLAKEFLERAGKYSYTIRSTYNRRVLITDDNGAANMRDQNYSVSASALFNTTETKIGGGSFNRYCVNNPTLENSDSYDNCTLTFYAGPQTTLTYRVFQYGPD